MRHLRLPRLHSASDRAVSFLDMCLFRRKAHIGRWARMLQKRASESENLVLRRFEDWLVYWQQVVLLESEDPGGVRS